MLIHSMTGYGDAAEQVEGIHYSVALHSLNNRYFKASVRLPDEVTDLEAPLESMLRKRLKRGSVSLSVRIRQSEAATVQQVNDAALVGYLEHLESIHHKLSSRDQTISIDLTALLGLPGVLEPSDGQDSLLHVAEPIILRLTHEACDKLIAMRTTEGLAIADDLAHHRARIRERMEDVAGRAPMVVEEYHQRLRARIDELLARAELRVEEKDLIHEVAIFADRADISEEVNRMGGHLDQFEQIVQSADGNSAGRTLDFLAQEMLREANTIASKSNDAPISRAIVEVKGAIDRIKEQVQNVQ